MVGVDVAPPSLLQRRERPRTFLPQRRHQRLHRFGAQSRESNAASTRNGSRGVCSSARRSETEAAEGGRGREKLRSAATHPVPDGEALSVDRRAHVQIAVVDEVLDLCVPERHERPRRVVMGGEYVAQRMAAAFHRQQVRMFTLIGIWPGFPI